MEEVQPPPTRPQGLQGGSAPVPQSGPALPGALLGLCCRHGQEVLRLHDKHVVQVPEQHGQEGQEGHGEAEGAEGAPKGVGEPVDQPAGGAGGSARGAGPNESLLQEAGWGEDKAALPRCGHGAAVCEPDVGEGNAYREMAKSPVKRGMSLRSSCWRYVASTATLKK